MTLSRPVRWRSRNNAMMKTHCTTCPFYTDQAAALHANNQEWRARLKRALAVQAEEHKQQISKLSDLQTARLNWQALEVALGLEHTAVERQAAPDRRGAILAQRARNKNG